MKALLIGLSATLVMGCSNTTSTQAAGEWVEADYTKPGAPLSLAYRDVKRVEVGDAPEVTLRVGDLEPGQAVQVDLAGTDGLELLGPSRRILQADDRGVAEFTVDVRALSDGMQYLNVFAGTGELGQRVISVPVAAGSGQVALKPAGKLSTDGDGNAIVVMDAKETINGVPQ